MPPSTAYEWSNAAGTTNFDEAANWVGGVVPPEEADVLFANTPSGQHWDAKEVHNASANRKLRSLWFETGFDYTLSGEALSLGETLEDGGRLITVLDRIGWQSEVTFNNAVNVTTENPNSRFLIYNESLGGLRFNEVFNTGGHEIWLQGNGPIRFSGAFSGVSGGAAGEIRVAMGDGHAVFTGNSLNWGGTVHVDSGMAVVSGNGALGSAAIATTVADGATLAFRQQNWGGLGPSVSYVGDKTIEIMGDGIERAGEGRVGALYNDGGNNRFDGSVVLLGDASGRLACELFWCGYRFRLIYQSRQGDRGTDPMRVTRTPVRRLSKRAASCPSALRSCLGRSGRGGLSRCATPSTLPVGSERSTSIAIRLLKLSLGRGLITAA